MQNINNHIYKQHLAQYNSQHKRIKKCNSTQKNVTHKQQTNNNRHSKQTRKKTHIKHTDKHEKKKQTNVTHKQKCRTTKQTE